MSEMFDKWGKEIAGRGFAQIPNYLLLLNQFLHEDKRLSPAELLVLIQLVGAWWRKDEMPFPALKTLAVRSGISDRQAQRAVSRLEEIGLIRRVKRKERGMIASNAYDLTPLVSFIGEVARAFPNEFIRKVRKDEKDKLDELLAAAAADAAVAAVEGKAKSIRLSRKVVKTASLKRPKRALQLDD